MLVAGLATATLVIFGLSASPLAAADPEQTPDVVATADSLTGASTPDQAMTDPSPSSDDSLSSDAAEAEPSPAVTAPASDAVAEAEPAPTVMDDPVTEAAPVADAADVVADATTDPVVTDPAIDNGSVLDDPMPAVDDSDASTMPAIDDPSDQTSGDEPTPANQPAAPVITSPAVGGAETVDPTPVIAGTGLPGYAINVLVDDQSVCSTTVDANGAWSCLSAPIADGIHIVEATQTGPDGITSPRSEIVDLLEVTAQPTFRDPANGASIVASQLVFTGGGEPGGRAFVTIDSTPVGSAVVNPDGYWTLTLTSPLALGVHTMSAYQTDSFGRTSYPSDNISFTTVADPPPVEAQVLAPAENTYLADPLVAISGTGQPKATITISDTDDSTVCVTTVNAAGSWACQPTAPLADGSHALTIVQTGTTADQTLAAHAWTLLIDTITPDAPLISSTSDTFWNNDAAQAITGSGEPGATIILSVDGSYLGQGLVNASGAWSVEAHLPDGALAIDAKQTDQAGHQSVASATINRLIDTVAQTPTFGSDLASTVSGDQPYVAGLGEAGASLTLMIDGVAVGQAEVLALPAVARSLVRAVAVPTAAVVAADGSWRIDLAQALSLDQVHQLVVTETDLANNMATASTTVGAAPVEPLLPTSPVDSPVSPADTPVNPFSAVVSQLATVGLRPVTVTANTGSSAATTAATTESPLLFSTGGSSDAAAPLGWLAWLSVLLAGVLLYRRSWQSQR
jgi:hypothetical protein